jgi:hypothetical protein
MNERRQHIQWQSRLLLDTVMDELIPSHWRCHCLNNIYSLISSFKKLASGQPS